MMRLILRLVSLVAVALGLFGLVASASPGPLVLVGRIEGAINPITERYVDRVLDEAEQRKAAAVVFTIDTPGGLVDSTYKITGRFLTAHVPIVTYGYGIQDSSPTPIEGLLHFIVDPQVAVLLFTIGTYGIIFELSNPSLLFPGIIGVMAVILALFAFGTLDANGAGIALMVFAVLLFIAEIKIVSHGLLTAGGIAALVVGLVILFPPLPTFPGVRASVDPLVIATIVGVTVVFFAFVFRLAFRMRTLPVVMGSHTLVGATGTAKSDIGPSGIAYVAGEDWSATADAPIARGSAVRVRRVDGVRLIVEPMPAEQKRGGA